MSQFREVGVLFGVGWKEGKEGRKEGGVSDEFMSGEGGSGRLKDDGPGMRSVLGHGASRKRMQRREIMSFEVDT